MAEKKEYRSAIRSRRLIREAFLALLQEKDYEKITVSDIVRRADLNRSTFYAHYPDIRGVVEEIQEEMFRQNIRLVEELDWHGILVDPVPCLRSMSDILGENMELLRRMGHTEQLHQRLDQFRRNIVQDLLEHKSIPECIRTSPDFSVLIHFFIGGIMNTYQQWAEGKLDCDPDEIAAIIAGLIRQSGQLLGPCP